MNTTVEEEIELCQAVERHGDEKSVKSKAIVKFSAVHAPAKFTRLQCNTDLNLPPSNWLSNSANSYGLQQFIYHSTGFASFQMAHKFPDCVGEVDVVSDAENIKNLLKLPYSPKNAISMMVHRVGNTLLIDEFDLQKYLLRQADDDWKWLRTFIVEHILTSLNEKDRNFFCIKDKSRSAVQRKNLLSKFLYHSLLQADHEVPSSNSRKSTVNQPLLLTGPVLPEPDLEKTIPDPNSKYVFNRNVVWTFEDIRMLVGTDMPIFGGGTRPCISLRLRDMARPISVLTGIDYWLDNLMCNVPEVVMCYHLDGIVQKYEIIKTEDLPYLEDSQFSPQVIRNVAQNILAFLKANATKAGHTYWLFKGRNDDVVKLYDLTTLCQHDSGDKKCENPFTVPVAMLLYTVARNMRIVSNKISLKTAGSIKVLLENCIKLLPKEVYPQIVTSSYYILSDLYIPAYIDPKFPDFEYDNHDSESAYEDDFSSVEYDDLPEDINETYESTNVAVKNICETLKDFDTENSRKNNKAPPPLIASIQERCRIALQHVYDGLNCLQYLNPNDEAEQNDEFEKEDKQKIIQEEQNPNMTKPNQPIPLPYEPLKGRPNRVDPKIAIPLHVNQDRESNPLKGKWSKGKAENIKDEFEDKRKCLLQDNIKIGNSWTLHLKLLLIEKACLIYAILVEHYYNLEQYGKCLHLIYMALRCQRVVISYVPSTSLQESWLLGRAGDAFFQFAKNWEKVCDYISEFKTGNELDDLILLELENKLDEDDSRYVLPMENIEGLLLQSIHFYEEALPHAENDCRIEIMRRLGSVRNEMGLKYMHWAKSNYDRFVDVSNHAIKWNEEILYETLTFKSYDSFVRALAAFEEVKDNLNAAFVLCNMGRFMRYRAHIHLSGEKPDDLQNQRKFYKESFTCYNRALNVLGSRKDHLEIWDAIKWDYSTATFSLAQLLQNTEDTNSLVCIEFEKEAMLLLQDSLKFCKGEHCASHELLYKYRAGLVHHRLATIHHNINRRTLDESERKRSLQLAFLHYEKAAAILEDLGEVADYFKTQVKHCCLMEAIAENQSGIFKVRSLHKMLNLILSIEVILEFTKSEDFDISKTISEIMLFEEKLQQVLRSLTKICSTDFNDSSKLSKAYLLYKKLYAVTLKAKPKNASEFVPYFSSMLNELKRLGGTDIKKCLV